MGKRRLTSRQRRQRAKIIRNRVITLAVVLMLAAAAMAPALREQLMQVIGRGIHAVQAFTALREGETVIVLEPIALYMIMANVRRANGSGSTKWAFPAQSGRKT